MTERLLHFIWQFQYFNVSELCLENGEALQIIKSGLYNTNQGPDFTNASIKIGTLIFAGSVELHINSSDWYKHQHAKDGNYNNVILHVVWQNDKPVQDSNGMLLPTLVLQNRVAKVLLTRYESLMNEKTSMPCKNFLPALSDLGWLSWKERLVAERLELKSKRVLQLLEKSNNHWEEVFWWLLARNFGIKVNADFFENIATTISVNILAKHKNQIHQIEALLLGQANLLAKDFTEDYPKLLQREYHFLLKKYQLQQLPNAPLFLRMRPAAFPTIRLAQLAMLITKSTHLFSKIKEIENIKEVQELLNVTANDYWHYHYQFDEATNHQPKNLGTQMINNIIINTIIPVLFAYGLHNKEEVYKTKAIQWLQQLQPEQNTITKAWKTSGIGNTSAFDSQSLIQLTNFYCKEKNCLACAVGNKVLKG